MATFYDNKREAQLIIINMINSGATVKEIEYKILMKYGFSKSFVEKFLQMYEENNVQIRQSATSN